MLPSWLFRSVAERATPTGCSLLSRGDDAIVVWRGVRNRKGPCRKGHWPPEFDVFLDNFDKTLEKRFREQAEILDERFADVNRNFAVVHSNIGALQNDVTVLQKDVTIVREGVRIILQKLG